jgi:molybdopterin molybdotransferase
LADEFANFDKALQIVLENVPVLSAVEVSIHEAVGWIAAEDVRVRVSSPSVNVSLMDGFAVSSGKTASASEEKPVRLRIAGEAAAGGQGTSVGEGECVRIFTGAAIPAGADAVIPVEQCEEVDGEIAVRSAVTPGQYVQPAGEDFHAGEELLKRGTVIGPGMAGMLAAAGIERVSVFGKPGVAVIALGDELVEPGTPIAPEKIYASNLVVISAWLARFGMESTTKIVADEEEAISEALRNVLETGDAVITTGGAWGSRRDLTVGVLEKLGWKKLFGRVKMRPGKGTAFGLLDGKPVFVLPGSPTSCEMAFLQLALPGLLRMAGLAGSPFASVKAVLAEEIKGKRPGWRRFVYGVYTREPEAGWLVRPLQLRSRLKSMARATCVIVMPEDAGQLNAGREVLIQIISST